MTNLIVIDGQIGGDFFGMGVTLQGIRNQIDDNADSIEVHINSVGGDVDEGFAIHDFLVSTGKPITTVVIGKSYSIATIIMLAGKKRLMEPNAQIMIHNPWGQPPPGTAEELQQYTDLMQKTEDKIVNFYADTTRNSKTKIRELMDAQTFMNYEEAKDLGFVTGEVVKLKAVALYNPKNTNMELNEKDKNEIKGWISEVKDSLKGFFVGKIKSMVLETNDKKIFVKTDSDDVIGKEAFAPNDAGEISETVATDGVYDLKDGRKATIKAGKVESLETPKDEVTELKEQIAAKDSEIETLKAEKATAEANVQDSIKKVSEVQAKLKDIETKIFGQEPPKPKKQIIETDEEFEGLNSWAKSLKN